MISYKFLAGFGVLLFCLAAAVLRASAETSMDSAVLSKRVANLSDTVKKQGNEIELLSKSISKLGSAIAELNKKNQGVADSVNVLEKESRRIAEDNLAIKSLLRKSNEDSGELGEVIEKQSELIEELNQKVRLLQKSVASLQENQSIDEYNIKKEYTRDIEDSKKTSRLLNLLAVVLSLTALAVAL